MNILEQITYKETVITIYEKNGYFGFYLKDSKNTDNLGYLSKECKTEVDDE